MGCEMKGIKKITALFLIMILTISTSGFVNKVESAQVSKSQTNDSPISMGVSAHAYVVMDANSGEMRLAIVMMVGKGLFLFQNMRESIKNPSIMERGLPTTFLLFQINKETCSLIT